MGVYEVCGSPNAERHHIVFRSQGGLDFELNFKDLCAVDHKGDGSPHKDRRTDLKYKRELQEKLFNIFVDVEYSITEISEAIGCKKKDVERRFKTAWPNIRGNYDRETVVRVLMGGRLY